MAGQEQERAPIPPPSEGDTISLLDILAVLVKRRWLIIGTTLIAAVIVVLFSVYTLKAPRDSPWNPMPNFYRAEVKILLQPSTQRGISAQLSGADSALNLLLGGGVVKDTNLALAEGLMQGNTLKDRIIEELQFLEKYQLSEAEFPKSAARKIFSDALKVEQAKENAGSNILAISYRDIDPVFAYQILSRITEILEERFKGLTLERIQRKKSFIEERLRTGEEELRETQSEMAEFQLKYGIIDLSAQAEQQNQMIAGLRSEIIKAQLELKSLREYLAESDPRIIRLKQEIENKTNFIAELRRGLQDLAGVYIPQKVVPELMTKYLSLESELKIHEAVFSTLRQEYESVKIEEADNSRVFQIVESAEVPEMKAGPSRGKICIIVTVAAFFLSVFAAFIREYFDRVRRDPVESEKLAGIRAMIRPRKRR